LAVRGGAAVIPRRFWLRILARRDGHIQVPRIGADALNDSQAHCAAILDEADRLGRRH
jgi:hypothetical protein